ncbi:MAG: sigma-70 family RNA polymerase sigma factor [Verrucomicrobiota bacterium]|nr:sigma-70 family RNA polymerase sigma factor [Verrucomicrobiota bacterium]
MPDDSAYASADDAKLVEWAKLGELNAFEVLVSRHRDRVYARAYSIMRNEDLAVDLSQSAWVKAWQRLHQFHGDAGFLTWLSRIVTNLCMDELRRQKRVKMDSIEAMEDFTGPVESRLELEAINPADRLEREELKKRIDAALAKLSDNHRMVIVLYEFEQLEYQRIAEKMGTSIGTVMSRLFYARKRLASLLNETLKRDGLIE